MKAISLFWAILATAPVLSGKANGQISWDSRQLDLRPSATDPAIHGEFTFTNTGDRTITITEVKSSCDCTTAELLKKKYAPGEKGSIKATFTIGNRVGLQQKQVMVRTDSLEEPLVELTLRAFIPELLKAEPSIIHWDQNEDPTPRSVELSTVTEQSVRVLGVDTDDHRVSAKLTTLEPGKRYRVTVTPSETKHRLRTMLRMISDYPGETPKVYTVPIEIGVNSTTTAVQPSAAKRLILNPPK